MEFHRSRAGVGIRGFLRRRRRGASEKRAQTFEAELHFHSRYRTDRGRRTGHAAAKRVAAEIPVVGGAKFVGLGSEPENLTLASRGCEEEYHVGSLEFPSFFRKAAFDTHSHLCHFIRHKLGLCRDHFSDYLTHVHES